jgi:hypothetical protein
MLVVDVEIFRWHFDASSNAKSNAIEMIKREGDQDETTGKIKQ